MNYSDEFLLDRIYNNLQIDNKKKLNLERPKISILNKRTNIENFVSITNVMKRDINDIMNYFKQELSTDDITLSANGILSIKGMYKQGNIEIIFGNYINKHVTCPVCKSFNTEIVKENKIKYIKCACKSQTAIS